MFNMKNIAIGLLFVFLTGCASNSFSSKEYKKIDEIGVLNLVDNTIAVGRLTIIPFNTNAEIFKIESPDFNPNEEINSKIKAKIQSKPLVMLDTNLDEDTIAQIKSGLIQKNTDLIFKALSLKNEKFPNVVIIVEPNTFVYKEPFKYDLIKTDPDNLRAQNNGIIAYTFKNTTGIGNNQCIASYSVYVVIFDSKKIWVRYNSTTIVEGVFKMLSSTLFWNRGSLNPYEADLKLVRDHCLMAIDYTISDMLKDLNVK